MTAYRTAMAPSVRRRLTPVKYAKALLGAIVFIRQQKQIPNFERISRYLQRNTDVTPYKCKEYLNNAVSDGLIEEYTTVGVKGQRTGLEQEGYRIPLSGEVICEAMAPSVRRRLTPVKYAKALLGAIVFIRQQKQIPNFERISRYLQRNTDVTPYKCKEYLNNAVSDGLIEEYTTVGVKGQRTGLEQEGYRIPLSGEVICEDNGHDWYCFECHDPGDVYECSDCFRVYHQGCTRESNVEETFTCSICRVSRQKTKMNKKMLNTLLSYTILRLKEKTRELHEIGPMATSNDLRWFVYRKMDLCTMEQKVQASHYRCLEDFHADARLILHNYIILFGEQKVSLVDMAATMVRDCKHDLDEIELCPNCYYMSNAKLEDWFSQPCNPPHELVYAKQKGYCYWPAKVVKDLGSKFDVRFFGGGHQRAVIPAEYIKPITTDLKYLAIKKTWGFQNSMKELKRYQEILEGREQDLKATNGEKEESEEEEEIEEDDDEAEELEEKETNDKEDGITYKDEHRTKEEHSINEEYRRIMRVQSPCRQRESIQNEVPNSFDMMAECWQGLDILHCSPCSLKTTESGLFQAHNCKSTQHITASVSYNIENAKFTCSLCRVELPEKDFSEHLEAHISLHPYSCKYCNQECTSRKDIQEHLRFSHSQDDPSFLFTLSARTQEILQKAKNNGKEVYNNPVASVSKQCAINPVCPPVPNIVPPLTTLPQSRPLPASSAQLLQAPASTYISQATSAAVLEVSWRQTSPQGHVNQTSDTFLSHDVSVAIQGIHSHGIEIQRTSNAPLNFVNQVHHSPIPTVIEDGNKHWKNSPLVSSKVPLRLQNPADFGNSVSRVNLEHPVSVNESSRVINGVSSESSQIVSLPVPKESCNPCTIPKQNSGMDTSIKGEVSDVVDSEWSMQIRVENIVSLSDCQADFQENMPYISSESTLNSQISTLSETTKYSELSTVAETTEHSKLSTVAETTENQRNIIEPDKFSYLRVVKGFFVCLICRMKWCRDYDLFFKHIWQKHVHGTDFSCCPMGYSANCARLQTVVNIIFDKSQEPVSAHIRKYFSQNSTDIQTSESMHCLEDCVDYSASAAVCAPSNGEKQQQSLAVARDIPSTSSASMDSGSVSCNHAQILSEETDTPGSVSCNLAQILSEETDTPGSVSCNLAQILSVETNTPGNLAQILSEETGTLSKENNHPGDNVVNTDQPEHKKSNVYVYEDISDDDDSSSKSTTNYMFSLSENLFSELPLDLSRKAPRSENSLELSMPSLSENLCSQLPLDLSGKAPRSENSLELSVPSLSENLCSEMPLDLSRKAPRREKSLEISVTSLSVCEALAASTLNRIERFSTESLGASDGADEHSLKFFFECGFHNCLFTSPKAMNFHIHMQHVHDLENEFPCVHCGYRSSSIKHLMQHMEEHIKQNKTKTFSCSLFENKDKVVDIENNDVRFILKMLKTSLAENSENDALFHFGCNICQSDFVALGELTEHLQKSLLKVIHCKHCESYFLNSFSWQKHMATEHVDLSRMYTITKKLLCYDRKMSAKNSDQISHPESASCQQSCSEPYSELAVLSSQAHRNNSLTHKSLTSVLSHESDHSKEVGDPSAQRISVISDSLQYSTGVCLVANTDLNISSGIDQGIGNLPSNQNHFTINSLVVNNESFINAEKNELNNNPDDLLQTVTGGTTLKTHSLDLNNKIEIQCREDIVPVLPDIAVIVEKRNCGHSSSMLKVSDGAQQADRNDLHLVKDSEDQMVSLMISQRSSISPVALILSNTESMEEVENNITHLRNEILAQVIEKDADRDLEHTVVTGEKGLKGELSNLPSNQNQLTINSLVINNESFISADKNELNSNSDDLWQTDTEATTLKTNSLELNKSQKDLCMSNEIELECREDIVPVVQDIAVSVEKRNCGHSSSMLEALEGAQQADVSFRLKLQQHQGNNLHLVKDRENQMASVVLSQRSIISPVALILSNTESEKEVEITDAQSSNSTHLTNDILSQVFEKDIGGELKDTVKSVDRELEDFESGLKGVMSNLSSQCLSHYPDNVTVLNHGQNNVSKHADEGAMFQPHANSAAQRKHISHSIDSLQIDCSDDPVSYHSQDHEVIMKEAEHMVGVTSLGCAASPSFVISNKTNLSISSHTSDVRESNGIGGLVKFQQIESDCGEEVGTDAIGNVGLETDHAYCKEQDFSQPESELRTDQTIQTILPSYSDMLTENCFVSSKGCLLYSKAENPPVARHNTMSKTNQENVLNLPSSDDSRAILNSLLGNSRGENKGTAQSVESTTHVHKLAPSDFTNIRDVCHIDQDPKILSQKTVIQKEGPNISSLKCCICGYWSSGTADFHINQCDQNMPQTDQSSKNYVTAKCVKCSFVTECSSNSGNIIDTTSQKLSQSIHAEKSSLVSTLQKSSEENVSDTTKNKKCSSQERSYHRLIDECGSTCIDQYLKPLYTTVDGIFTCTRCRQNFNSLKRLHCHLFLCQGKVGVVLCSFCLYQGDHEKAVVSHIESQHNDQDINLTLRYCYLRTAELVKILQSHAINTETFMDVCSKMTIHKQEDNIANEIPMEASLTRKLVKRHTAIENPEKASSLTSTEYQAVTFNSLEKLMTPEKRKTPSVSFENSAFDNALGRDEKSMTLHSSTRSNKENMICYTDSSAKKRSEGTHNLGAEIAEFTKSYKDIKDNDIDSALKGKLCDTNDMITASEITMSDTNINSTDSAANLESNDLHVEMVWTPKTIRSKKEVKTSHYVKSPKRNSQDRCADEISAPETTRPDMKVDCTDAAVSRHSVDRHNEEIITSKTLRSDKKIKVICNDLTGSRQSEDRQKTTETFKSNGEISGNHNDTLGRKSENRHTEEMGTSDTISLGKDIKANHIKTTAREKFATIGSDKQNMGKYNDTRDRRQTGDIVERIRIPETTRSRDDNISHNNITISGQPETTRLDRESKIDNADNDTTLGRRSKSTNDKVIRSHGTTILFNEIKVTNNETVLKKSAATGSDKDIKTHGKTLNRKSENRQGTGIGTPEPKSGNCLKNNDMIVRRKSVTTKTEEEIEVCHSVPKTRRHLDNEQNEGICHSVPVIRRHSDNEQNERIRTKTSKSCSKSEVSHINTTVKRKLEVTGLDLEISSNGTAVNRQLEDNHDSEIITSQTCRSDTEKDINCNDTADQRWSMDRHGEGIKICKTTMSDKEIKVVTNDATVESQSRNKHGKGSNPSDTINSGNKMKVSLTDSVVKGKPKDTHDEATECKPASFSKERKVNCNDLSLKRKSQESQGRTKKQKFEGAIQSAKDVQTINIDTADSVHGFKCSSCTFTSQSYTESKKHVKSQHSNDKSAKVCRSLPKKTNYANSVARKTHDIYRCIHSDCNFTCQWNTDIMKEHINVKHPYYSCGYCNASYTLIHFFEKHCEFVHPGMKPHSVTSTISLDILFKHFKRNIYDDGHDEAKIMKSQRHVTSKKTTNVSSKGKESLHQKHSDRELKTTIVESFDVNLASDLQSEPAFDGVKALGRRKEKASEECGDKLPSTLQTGITLHVDKNSLSKKEGILEQFLVGASSEFEDQGRSMAKLNINSNTAAVSDSFNSITKKPGINLFEKTSFVRNAEVGLGVSYKRHTTNNNLLNTINEEDKRSIDIISTSEQVLKGGQNKEFQLEDVRSPSLKDDISLQNERKPSNTDINSVKFTHKYKKILSKTDYPFRCTLCRRIFSRLIDIEKHFKEAHPTDVVQVTERVTGFVYLSSGQCMIGNHDRKAADSHICRYCSFRSMKRFTSQSYTESKKHVKSQHSNDKSAKVCRSLPKKSDSTNSVARKRTHDIYSCIHSNCNFTCQWNTDIMKEHINVKHPYYSCEYCNASYIPCNFFEEHCEFVHPGMKLHLVTSTISLDILFKHFKRNIDDDSHDEAKVIKSKRHVTSKKTTNVSSKGKESLHQKHSDRELKTTIVESFDVNLASDLQSEPAFDGVKALGRRKEKASEECGDKLPSTLQTGITLHVDKNSLSKKEGILEQFLVGASSEFEDQGRPMAKLNSNSNTAAVSDSFNSITKKPGINLFEKTSFVRNAEVGLGVSYIRHTTNNNLLSSINEEDKRNIDKISTFEQVLKDSQNKGFQFEDMRTPSLKDDISLQNERKPSNTDINSVKFTHKYKKILSKTDYPFRCTLCRRIFSRLIDIEKHFKEAHPTDVVQLTERVTGLVNSGQCLTGNHDRKAPADSHICRYCSFRSIKKSDVETHISNVHPLRDIKVFTLMKPNSVDLSLEAASHPEASRSNSPVTLSYRCNICNDVQNSEFLFRLHLASHPCFKCTAPLMTGASFMCHTCGYVSRSSSDLAQHTGEHMSERRFKCFMCEHDSHNKKGVKAHIRLVHDIFDNDDGVIDRNKLRREDLRPRLVNIHPQVSLTNIFSQHPNDLQQLLLKCGIKELDLPGDVCADILVQNTDKYFEMKQQF